MIHRSLATRRRRTAIAAAASAATALTTLAGVGTAAPAAAAPDPACTPWQADSNFDSDAIDGMSVHGLTTTHGTTPEGFTGTVLGAIDDGIGPGIDMIMARLTSDEIDRVGIWQGMSGSPVYAPNGELLGAVAWGLSWGPSTVAGITPAAAMFDVAHRLSPAAAPRKVPLTAAMRREVFGARRLSARAQDASLTALKTPFAVSGIPSDVKLGKVKRKFGLKNVKMYRSAPAPVTASAAAAAEIKPGGNLVASFAYGELTAGGLGTVTAVCDGAVVGFGHPFWYTGKTNMTMHGATTLYIQEDPTFPGFAVANPSAPVGTISQDRLAGLAGTVGAPPEATLLRTTVTDDANGNGTADTGERTRTSNPTYVTDDSVLADATWFAQLWNDFAVFDSYGPGSATTRYTITGKADNAGTPDVPFTLNRANRFQSDWDIPDEAAYDAADTVWTLYRNNITDVDFDTVTTNTLMSDEARMFRVKQIEVRKSGEWKTVRNYRTVSAKPGGTLKFRVHLASYRNRYGSKTVRINVDVPDVTHRTFGYVAVAGGDNFYRRPKGKTFADLVESIESRPRNDQLVADLNVRERHVGRIKVTSVKQLGAVVRGGKFFELNIRTSGSSGGGIPECRTAARGC